VLYQVASVGGIWFDLQAGGEVTVPVGKSNAPWVHHS
jgi:hypothetical protein